MLAKFLKTISPIVKIYVLLILLLMIFLAKSLYLIFFLTVFILILLLAQEKKVNSYVNIIKKVMLILFFFYIFYIIMLEKYQTLTSIVLIYKLILYSMLISVFVSNMTFKEFHEGLYGVFIPLKKLNVNVENFTLDLAFTFYFIKKLLFSSNEIKKVQIMRGKKKINIKNYFLPIFIYSIDSLNKYEENLKTNFYKLNYKKVNTKSKFILAVFLVLFVLCILKEVIL